MTLNYRMLMEWYPNRTEWLADRYPAMKSFLYLMEKLARWSSTSYIPIFKIIIIIIKKNQKLV